MTTKLQDLQEKRNKQAATIKSLADRQDEWSAEDRTAWEAVNDDYNATSKEMDQARAADEVQKRADDVAEQQEQSRNTVKPGLDDAAGAQDRTGLPQITDEHRRLSLQAWMRSGHGMEVSEREQTACDLLGVNHRNFEFRASFRAADNIRGAGIWSRSGRPMFESRAGLTVGTDSEGGYTAPEGFVNELERQMLAFNGPRQVCRVVRTANGSDLPWPTVNDTSNTGALLAEATTIGSSVDPTFGVTTFNAYKYSSKPILVSQELLEDSAFNLGEVIASLLGERLGRITAAQYTTGSGSSQPNGVVTASGLGVTTASTTAITGDEIIDLAHSLDPAYRGLSSVGFMLHDTVLKAVRKLKDGDSRYLWEPSVQAGVPDMLFGYPVSVNQDMSATITAADKTMLFGAFEKFVIRDVADIRLHRLEERYRDVDQTGFVAFFRTDSDTIQAAALKHMIQAAS